MVTYEKNLKEPDSITIAECEKIYTAIVKQIEAKQDGRRSNCLRRCRNVPSLMRGFAQLGSI